MEKLLTMLDGLRADLECAERLTDQTTWLERCADEAEKIAAAIRALSAQTA